MGSGRPRRPQNPFQTVGGEAPRILEWFLGPPGPPKPPKSTISGRPQKPCIKNPSVCPGVPGNTYVYPGVFAGAQVGSGMPGWSQMSTRIYIYIYVCIYKTGYPNAVWPDFLGACLRAGLPRGPGKPFKNVGGFAPHIFEAFPPPGPARPRKRTQQIRPGCFQVPR